MHWKIATRVAVSDRSLGCFYPTPNMNDTRYIPSDIQVSEFQGDGRVHRYSMKHPACWPELYGDGWVTVFRVPRSEETRAVIP